MAFGIFKQALASGQRQIAKVTSRDMLEGAVCGALYLAASGGIDNDEIDQLLVSLNGAKPLEAFSSVEKSSVVGRFRDKVANSPRMAKIELKKEVEEAITKGGPDAGMTIVSIALDVADQGGLSDDEAARAAELCQWCRVSPSEFGL